MWPAGCYGWELNQIWRELTSIPMFCDTMCLSKHVLIIETYQEDMTIILIKKKTLHIMSYQVLSNHDMIYAMLKKHQKPVSSKSILYPICSMVLVYLPTWLGDFGEGQMLGFIFQHHGSHMGYTKKHQRRCVVLPASRTAMAAQNCESGRSSKSARHGGFFGWYGCVWK